MNHPKKTILTALFAILALTLNAKVAESSSYSEYPFIIITSDTVSEAPTFTDEEFYRLSTSVIFKVNRTEVDPNDPFLSLYSEKIRDIVNRQHLQLRKIYIRGAASPEGPYLNNQRLGRGRSQFLLNKLQQGLSNQYLEVDREVSSVTEDYGYLCVLMKGANDPEYNVVKRIYDDCGADEQCCKKQLMAYQNGRLWKRLLTQYFPQLRAARMILWFSTPDEKHAPLTLLEGEPFGPEDITIVPPSLPQAEYTHEITYTRRHLIAVRTNLLHDFFYMPQFGWAFSPNLQLEYYPLDGHYTYNLGVTWGTNRKWDTQKFFQVRDFQLELRRYFRGGGTFLGPYLGVHLHGDKYGIGLGPDKGWQGEGGGAGLSLGCVLPLNHKKNLRLEFMAEVGYFFTLFDPYVYGNPLTGEINGHYYYDYLGTAQNFKKRNHTFSWFGPVNLGIQLTYDIIYRKKKLTIPIAD